MDAWIGLFLPVLLLVGRIGAFFTVLPLFNWSALPGRLRAGLAMAMILFFAVVRPPAPPAVDGWTAAGLLMASEVLRGLSLGLAVSLVYLAVQQGGRMMSLQMGLGDAEIIDPVSSEPAEPMDMFFDVTFALVFLTADAHHLFIGLINRSYDAFPAGQPFDTAVAADALIQAGSAMLELGLKLAGPLLVASLVLAIVLAVVGRVLPELDVMFASFPLRVSLGLFIAAAIIPALDAFTFEVAGWIDRMVAT